MTTSLAAIRRSIQPGTRIKILCLDHHTTIAIVTDVDKNGFWWRHEDNRDIGTDMNRWNISGWRPKRNDGKTYWYLAAAYILLTDTEWIYEPRKPWSLKYEVLSHASSDSPQEAP